MTKFHDQTQTPTQWYKAWEEGKHNNFAAPVQASPNKEEGEDKTVGKHGASEGLAHVEGYTDENVLKGGHKE